MKKSTLTKISLIILIAVFLVSCSAKSSAYRAYCTCDHENIAWRGELRKTLKEAQLDAQNHNDKQGHHCATAEEATEFTDDRT